MSEFNVKAEVQFVHEAVGQLKDYLLSDEVYWNLGSDPQLTLGNLLMAVAYLRAVGKLPEADAARLDELHKEWKSAWEKKAGREFASRMRLWMQYLNELSDHPDRHADYYAAEVRVRALLELLADEAPGLRGQLAAPDSKLKALTVSGDFVWNAAAKAAFPKGKYWFLWVKAKIA